MRLFNAVAPIAKSVVAAIVAGLSVLASGFADGGLSWSEGIAAAIAFFAGLIAVFSIPNRAPSG